MLLRLVKKVRSVLGSAAKAVFRAFGLELVSTGELQALKKKSSFEGDLAFVLDLGQIFPSGWLSAFLPKSRSQLRQDLFVLGTLGIPQQGFFVEFGASDGVVLSNSYVLETEFGWNGILAEPAIGWTDELHRNRACRIDTRCVWSESNQKVWFNETTVGEFSTVSRFSESDSHAKTRRNGQIYEVETVSLLDLLEQHSAPEEIDYLSIDTEGSELEILESFDFSRYSFRVITVEHNFTAARPKIKKLLESHGYKRVHENLSHFDDWYVLT